MAAPWEKYGGTSTAASGPWAKYGGTPAAPADTRTPIQQLADSVPGTPEADAAGARVNQANAANPAPEHSFTDDIGDFRITPDMDLRSLWTTIKGAPETAAGMATNAGVAGVAGLTAPFVSANDDDSANYIRDFTSEHSYTPQGDSARQLTGAIGDAFAPVEHAKRGLGDTIMDATGSPGLATAGYMAPDLATVLLGPKPGASESVSDLRAPGADLSGGAPPLQKAPRVNPDNPVSTARAAGYKLLPSDIERVTLKKPGLGDRIAEAIAPEDVRRDMTLENQGTTNQLAREKLGAPEDARLDRRGITKLKEPHFKTYEEVQNAVNVVPPSADYQFALDEATQRAGFPQGSNPSVTEVISALRTKARRKINNPNADDKLEAEGRLAGQAADKLEDAMGTELKNTGQEELLTKYQDARTKLAELNDVEKSQRGGNVDPQKLKKLDAKNPDRMTGQTKLAADVADNFPDVRSSMTGAGKKGAKFGEVTKEGIVKKVAKKAARGVARVVPGLGDRLLVESEGFQNRLGKAANPAERSYFSDYGKKNEIASSPGAVDPERALEFGTSGGVTPSKAVTLSDHLGLEPEPVANPQKLPDKPDMLTADTPKRTRGDIEPHFDAQAEADKLAGDLGIDIRTGTHGAPGKQELSDLIAAQRSDGFEVAPPREMEQLDMPVGEKTQHLQLTKPNQRAKVSSAVDKAGNVTVRHEDGGEITAVELPDQGTLQIKNSIVPSEARGQGRGQAMAQQLISMAKKKGLRLVSDNRVSDSAQAMWAALKKKGLNVKQNPATRQASGELVSKSDLKPVFEIVDDLVAE